MPASPPTFLTLMNGTKQVNNLVRDQQSEPKHEGSLKNLSSSYLKLSNYNHFIENDLKGRNLNTENFEKDDNISE